MKRSLFLLVTVFALFLQLSAAGAGESDLFRDAQDPIPSPWADVSADIVLRQRPVLVQFDMLSPDKWNVLHLNFFDDVQVTAVLDHLEESPFNGGQCWIGTVTTANGGEATFVLVDQRLTGTVRLVDLWYQVRHIDGNLHLVREIRAPEIDTRLFSAFVAPEDVETEVLTLVNHERQIQNLHPLNWDNRLFEAADGHSTDMALQDYFSHDSPDGRSAGDRITAAGYPWATYGENIGGGYSSPQAVMEGWMNSSGHRANILSSYFCDLGVGHFYNANSRFRHYWTQDFGREQGASTCSVAPQQYSIAATAGPNGTISPAGIVPAASGEDVEFSMTANPGYRLADVVVDGQSVGAMSPYVFYDITDDHNIEAYFVIAVTEKKNAPWIPLLLLEE